MTLTGALVDRDPPTAIGPVEPEVAANALVAYLRRNGCLDAGESDSTGV